MRIRPPFTSAVCLYLLASTAFADDDVVSGALLHKSADGRTASSAGQTYPTTLVTGMPSAVKPLRTATRTWNSAT